MNARALRSARSRARHAAAPLLVALAALLAMAGCEPTPPTAAPSVSGAPATRSPTSRPTIRPTDGPGAALVSLNVLPPEFVPNNTLRSLGDSFIWTMGPESTADIWRATPGEGPVRVFENPLRDSLVANLVVGPAGVAFTEMNDRAYGEGDWRVWFLPTGAAVPIEVDRGNAFRAGSPPALAMDDRRLVWAGILDVAEEDITTFMRVAPLADLTAVETVMRLPAEDALLHGPVLEGDVVWYAIVDPDIELTGVGDEFHIEFIDLASADRARHRFPGSGGNDFAPVVTPSVIAWKTVEPGYSALSWGELRLLDRESGTVTPVPATDVSNASIGSRFMTFEEIHNRRLYLYDLATGRLLDESGAIPPPFERIGGEHIVGNLFVCRLFGENLSGRIAWARLPG